MATTDQSIPAYLVAIQVIYLDNSKRSVQVIVPGVDGRSAAIFAANLARRTASRPIDDLMAIPIAPTTLDRMPRKFPDLGL